MKANVPEKIYLYPYSTDGIYEVETKPLEGTIEYIRKDAFVEKVMKYIANHFLVPGMDSEIKDFVNYMEGK